jgi:hypothetical protein
MELLSWWSSWRVVSPPLREDRQDDRAKCGDEREDDGV